MTDLAHTAQEYVNGSKARWLNLVEIALTVSSKQLSRAAIRLAQLTGESETSVSHRMKAVRFAREQGSTAEQIKAKLQKQVVADYITGKRKARSAPLVAFPHKLTPAVRDAFDANCRRIGKVLKLKTWDEVIQFINSQIETATDQDLLHGAGGEK